jgi:hypothetical protein
VSRAGAGPGLAVLRALRKTSGVTLIEMIIAVTLVAAIITGLLMSMRTGLAAYQKVNQRLEDNRRVMGLDQALHRQLGGIMPVTALCPGGLLSAFVGGPQSLRYVSSSSLAEGARGYPRIVEYLVAPDPQGGLRLMMSEHIYGGPSSLAPLCGPQGFVPVALAPDSVEMAGRLAFCRFSYRRPAPDSPVNGDWQPGWLLPDLPRAVRIEMEPVAADSAHLPMLTVSVPVRVNRLVLQPYADTK